MADYNGDLKVVINQQASLIKKIDRIEGKMDSVCDMTSRHDEKITVNKEEIKSLRNRSNVNDVAVAIAAAVSSAIAAVIGANR